MFGSYCRLLFASSSHNYAHGTNRKQIVLATVLKGVSQDVDGDKERTGTEIRPEDACVARGRYRCDSVKAVENGSTCMLYLKQVLLTLLIR